MVALCDQDSRNTAGTVLCGHRVNKIKQLTGGRDILYFMLARGAFALPVACVFMC